jgi:hypothetical protein
MDMLRTRGSLTGPNGAVLMSAGQWKMAADFEYGPIWEYRASVRNRVFVLWGL